MALLDWLLSMMIGSVAGVLDSDLVCVASPEMT